MKTADITRHPACPSCGSKRYRFAATSFPMTDSGILSGYKIRDRTCKDCGTTYHPTIPPVVRYVCIFGGAATTLFGFFGFFEGEIGVGIMCVAVGGLMLAMGLMAFRRDTGKPEPNWRLGALQQTITLDDLKKNRVWVNDCSGEWEDGHDESSIRPVLDMDDVSHALLQAYASVSVLAECTGTGELCSIDIEPDGGVACLAVWRNSEWITGRNAFDGFPEIEIKAIPSILGERDVCFLYDPRTDKGKRN